MNIVNHNVLGKIGQIDYVKDGTLHRGIVTPSVLVTDASDLSMLPDDYPPGTMAFTAGFKATWQKNANGE